MVKNNPKNNLTKKEQSTTTAYKMMSEKINSLEASLKKTQDEAERIRSEKFELEKKYILLENKLKDQKLILFLEFISSAGLGFALGEFKDNFQLTLSVGVPSLIVYSVCIFLTKK